VEEPQGALEQGDGASIGFRVERAGTDDRETANSKRNRCRKSGCTGTDDQNIGFISIGGTRRVGNQAASPGLLEHIRRNGLSSPDMR
jgi:hypothetical protein